MKVLGIDYGTKRVGLAVSDELGMIAFPHAILAGKTRSLLIDELKNKIASLKIEKVVIGLPDDTRSARVIKEFAKDFEKAVGMFPDFINESHTSFEAFKGSHDIKQERGRKTKIDTSPKDDIAAALILQRYLDRQQKDRT